MPSTDSTALVCLYGRDVRGVMEGEVPFLVYVSYCADYLVLPDEFTWSSFSTLQLKTILPMHKIMRKPWDEQSGVFVSRAGWN